MVALADRFEAKVDRCGEHHVWLGSKKADGTGKLKVDGSTVTAPRVAWELAHGPLEDGAVVVACQARKDCVRVEHLEVRSPAGQSSPSGRRRAPKGAGTRAQVRPGVWKLSVSVGR